MLESLIAIGAAAIIGCVQASTLPLTIAVEKEVETRVSGVAGPDVRRGFAPHPMEKIQEWEAPMPEEHLAWLVACCEEYHVPVELVLAIIERESGFQADAVSSTQDYGYMQINQVNFNWAKRLQLNPQENPFDNIEFGIIMLDTMRDFCEDAFTWERVLMLYAMGPDVMNTEAWEQGSTDTIDRTMERAREIKGNGGI